MKKKIIIMILILITGCNKPIEGNITSLKIDGTEINEKDYEDLVENFNKLNFSKIEVSHDSNHQLLLMTDSGIIEYNISDKVIEMKKEGITYYSKNISTINKINDIIKKLSTDYTEDEFYKIELVDKYEINKNDFYHEIDTIDQYFIIKSDVEIEKFIINKTELIDNEYVDIEPLLTEKNINKNEDIVIRVNITKDYFTYKFTLVNEYNKVVEIIPYYDNDKEKNELKYIINYK